MRYKNNNSKLQLSFKKRYKFNNVNYLLKNTLCNKSAIITTRSFIFYFIYFRLIRKGLKNLYSKSYMLKKKINIFLTVMTNFPISNKSKNARMGKGKGSLVSWACRLPLGFFIFMFVGINIMNLKLINKSLNKIIPNSVTLSRSLVENKTFY